MSFAAVKHITQDASSLACGSPGIALDALSHPVKYLELKTLITSAWPEDHLGWQL